MASVIQVSCRLVRNLGNYETETCEMVSTVEDGEDAIAVYDALKQSAKAALGFRRERQEYEDMKDE